MRQAPPAAALTARQVSRIAGIILTVLCVGLVAAVVVLTVTRDWDAALRHLVIFIWASYVPCLVLALWLNRRGRSVAATRVMLVGLALVMAGMVTRVTNYGLSLSAALVLVTAFVVTQTRLPVRPAAELIAASIVAASAILLFDMFAPAGREPTSEQIQVLINLALAVLVVVLAGLSIRNWFDYRIGTKLAVAFIFTSALSVVLVSVITFGVVSADLTAQVGASLKTVAENKAQNIGNILEQQENLLLTLAGSQSVQDYARAANLRYGDRDAAAIAQNIKNIEAQWSSADMADPLIQGRINNPAAVEFGRFHSSQDNNLWVLLTDKYGAVVAATTRSERYYQGDEEWWQKAYNNGQGHIFVSPPAAAGAAPDWGIIIAGPVRVGYSSEVVGIVQIVFRLSGLAPALAVGQLGTTGAANLVFPSGQALSGDGAVSSVEPGLAVWLRAMPRSYERMNYRGRARLVSTHPIVLQGAGSARPITDLGWMVVVEQEPAEALAPVNRATQASILAGAGVLLFTLLIALGAASFMARPIVRLTQAAEQVTAGNLHVLVPFSYGDEIGALGRAFERMTAQLRQILETLEQRVADRTADLSHATDQLRARASELETSAVVSRVVGSSLQLEEWLPEISRVIAERFAAASVSIFIVEEAGERAVFQQGSGANPWARGQSVRRGQADAIGWALETGEAVLVQDQSPSPAGWVVAPAAYSELALPLKVAGQVVAVLHIRRASMDEWTEPESAHLAALGAQIAIGIQNARSFERQSALARENRRLLEQAQQTMAELNALNRRLTREGWEEYMESRPGPLVVEDAASEQARDGGPMPLLTAAAEKGELVTAADAGHRAMAVPLVVRGEIIGSLAVEGEEAGDWSPAELAIIRDIAEHAALAVENARLFEGTQAALARTRQLAEREARIASIGDQLHRATEVEGILRIAAEELRRTTGSARAVVRLRRSNGRPDRSGEQPELPGSAEESQ